MARFWIAGLVCAVGILSVSSCTQQKLIENNLKISEKNFELIQQLYKRIKRIEESP